MRIVIIILSKNILSIHKFKIMKVNSTINQTLNKTLSASLTMINQYFLHARMLNNWGFDELGNKNYHYSIKAMKESDVLIKRILFLEGLPNLQALGKLHIGENVSEILSCNLAMEASFRQKLQESIALTESEQDYVTRDHLNECLEDCEERLDFFETQIHISEQVGSENYHQTII